ncbi:17-beta-hydroxysteroid dehydrogenase 13-like isoform X2 [Limulus polyphemus]|uniref:17-beta-hydroxysteroid dehydrogenase 13-like isoform X2 n=1 Tax=Limulus polyphemus TaxID=6850 RepID=A0ABM1B322_LIMPO|nr:17-beta-hydroxysteroid dehydrogenase 13-like isoform X2 [Limulus polyphemus]
MEFITIIGKAWGTILQALIARIYFIIRIILPSPRKCIEGDVVLITGSGHGLGRQLAILSANLGATVVLWDIQKSTCESVAKEIEANGGKAYAYECDVSDLQKVEQQAKKVQEEVGDVTILINNAGVIHVDPLLNLNSQNIKRTFEVNVFSHFWTIQQFLPRMLERKKGHIVAISSAAGVIGSPYLTDYAASKHGVIGLMSSLREELFVSDKEQCIRLTTICPVLFDSGFVKRPHSRFPTILPVLTVNKVAQGALDGILREKNIVVLPSWVGYFFSWSSVPVDLMSPSIRQKASSALDMVNIV